VGFTAPDPYATNLRECLQSTRRTREGTGVNTTERERDVRPWGEYVVLEDEADAKVKRITVRPGKRLSYQRHQRRAEHWFVVAGTAHVTLDGVEHQLHAGQAIDIPRGGAHRIANPGSDDLVFIEVQVGDYFGEDDIERLEDDYGRA
jgi:mannose-6-phosphate isomerase